MAQGDEIVLNYDDDDDDGVKDGGGDHGDGYGNEIDGSVASSRHMKRARPPEDEAEEGEGEGEEEVMKHKKLKKEDWQTQTPQRPQKKKKNKGKEKGKGKGKPNGHSSEGFQGAASSERGRIDPSTGLRSAFPGLDDDDDHDGDGGGGLFYGPATNGIEYLRMVR